MPWNILQFKYLQLWYHWNTLTLLSELSEKGDCIQIASVWGLRFSRQWELRCCSISDGDRMFIRNVGYPPVSLHGVTTQNNVVQLLLCETADWNSCCGEYIWERFGLTTLYLPPGFLHVNIFFYNFLITLWVASLLILQPVARRVGRWLEERAVCFVGHWNVVCPANATDMNQLSFLRN